MAEFDLDQDKLTRPLDALLIPLLRCFGVLSVVNLANAKFTASNDRRVISFSTRVFLDVVLGEQYVRRDF
jgi:hypothetical protein